jgi:hypothetical protein
MTIAMVAPPITPQVPYFTFVSISGFIDHSFRNVFGLGQVAGIAYALNGTT